MRSARPSRGAKQPGTTAGRSRAGGDVSLSCASEGARHAIAGRIMATTRGMKAPLASNERMTDREPEVLRGPSKGDNSPGFDQVSSAAEVGRRADQREVAIAQAQRFRGGFELDLAGDHPSTGEVRGARGGQVGLGAAEVAGVEQRLAIG